MPEAIEFSEITEDEQERANELRALLDGDYDDARPAVVRARLNGVEVAVIAAAKDSEDGEGVDFWGVAILVNAEMVHMLDIPEEPTQ